MSAIASTRCGHRHGTDLAGFYASVGHITRNMVKIKCGGTT